MTEGNIAAPGTPVQDMEIRAGGANTSHEAGGDRGISGADQAKTSYLKEHFAYRRDLILKKTDCPCSCAQDGMVRQGHRLIYNM